MQKRKIALTMICALPLLGGCSMFGGSKDVDTKLDGERISVLELQKSLTPDRELEEGKEFDFPASWVNASWPQAGGYPNHSMHNLSLSNDLKRVWRVDIGRGSTDELPLHAQPIVAGGQIFTLDTKNKLSAFDALNGKKSWSVNVENKEEGETVISGGIAYAHGLIYVTNGYDEVLAVSPEDGEVIWRERLPAPSRAAPTVLNGRLYVTTIDSRLLALDAKNGQGLWEYVGISETAGLLGAGSAGANTDIVVPVFSSGEVTALRVENGSVVWSDNLASVRRYGGGLESLSDIKAMPIVDRGIIIAISFSGKIAAIDERTGTRLWQKEISGSQTPWVTGDLIFVVSTDNQLIAMSMRDGSIFWIEQLAQFEDEEDKEDPITWNGPLMAGGRLIIVGSNGEMLHINPNDGQAIGKTNLKYNVEITPIVANDMLYVLSDDGTLIAYQ